MAKTYFYVDFKRRTIKTIENAPNYAINETFVVIYRGNEKFNVPGYYEDRRTFYETQEQALEVLIDFCQFKIDKYINKSMKWSGRLDDVKETYTFFKI